MSHIYTYDANIKNALLFLKTCKDAGATQITTGEHLVNQYGSNQVPAIASCLLPDWRYPIAITSEGSIKYDHWGAKNGQLSMTTLTNCIQGYWKEEVSQAIDWMEVTDYREMKLDNGDVKLILMYDE
jgi:hypothetical protein